MKVKSLSEYIQKLQGASEILKRKKSFSDWLIEKKVDPDGDYKRGLLASDKKRSEAAPGYGKLGDNLHRSGLAVSGYADHLLAEKRLEAKAKKDSVLDTYEKQKAKSEAGYREYLSGVAKAEESAYSATVAAIRDAGILSESDALEYAIGRGLSKERAESAAIVATEAVRKKLKDRVTSEIIGRKLSYKEAKSLALSYGLSETDAKSLAEHARNINGTIYIDVPYPDFYGDGAKSNSEIKKKNTYINQLK